MTILTFLISSYITFQVISREWDWASFGQHFKDFKGVLCDVSLVQRHDILFKSSKNSPPTVVADANNGSTRHAVCTLLFDIFVKALIRISKTWLVRWLVSVQFDWRERKRPVNPLWRPHHRVEGVYEFFSLILWCLWSEDGGRSKPGKCTQLRLSETRSVLFFFSFKVF